MQKFNYINYLKLSNSRLAQELMIADYAFIIEKLTIWQNKGRDNPIWTERPTISPGANRIERIFDDVPYAIGLSSNTSEIIHEMTKDIPINPKNGGKRLDLKIEIEKTISLLSILSQYSLLEYYEFECYRTELASGKLLLIDTEKWTLDDFEKKGIDKLKNGRIEYHLSIYSRQGVKKRLTNWKSIGIANLSESSITEYEALSNRRNELTHEIDFAPPTIDEAIAYYHKCKELAQHIGHAFSDASLFSIIGHSSD